MTTLVIDIGGTKFTLALFQDHDATSPGARPALIKRLRQRTRRDAGRPWMTEALAASIPGFLESVSGAPPIARIGISFGGPVDFARQRVALSTHAPGWEGFDFASWLRTLLRLGDAHRIVIDNDANAGALGEARFGAASPQHSPTTASLPMFYVTLSTGIGGGLVLPGGEIYRGADSWAGELGHIALDPSGPECLCGARGCFERMCSGMWLERDHGRPAAELLAEDPFLDEYTAHLARGLKPVLMLLNPAVVVIGGGIAKTGERLFSRVNRELRIQMTDWSGARVNVVPAALGDDSVLWGAYALTATPES